MSRPTICLSMIVKDEVDVLSKLLDSCRELIDYWVICDTGSTDGTQDLIRRELSSIPGELHERPWINFAVNRSECMRLSKGRADYLLILDADTSIEAAPGALDGLTLDAYLLRHLEAGIQYHTKRLVRADLDWRYEGAVHEYIVCEEEQTTGSLDDVTIRTWSVGAIRHDRWESDIEMLQDALANDPSDTRSWFYLAQTYRDCGRQRQDPEMLSTALSHYQRRAEMGGWPEETYFAQYQVGVLAAEIGQWPTAMDAFARAWEILPRRLEAAHALTAGLRERDCHQAAHRLARMAASLQSLPMPQSGLFLVPWVYEWGMLFEYSITSYWVGEYRNSLAACKRLLNIPDLPDAHRQATISNMQHAVREMTRVEAERPRGPRRMAQVGTPTRGLPAPDRDGPAELRDSSLADRVAAACGLSRDDGRRLMRRGEPVQVSLAALGGLRVSVRPGTRDIVAIDQANEGARYLPDPELDGPGLIIDAGAGVGISTLHLAHLYPTARIVAVEPDPQKLELCARNLRPLGSRATLIEAAIATIDRPTGPGAPELTMDALLGHTADGAVVDHLRLYIGTSLQPVLEAAAPWPGRIRSIAAAPVAGDEQATSSALHQLRRRGFAAGCSGGWITGTRAATGAPQRRRWLARAGTRADGTDAVLLARKDVAVARKDVAAADDAA